MGANITIETFVTLVTGVTWLITMRGKIDHAPVLRPVKRWSFFFPSLFLSLHHPNNRSENISIFYFPLFNSVAQKNFLVRNNIGGAFAPPLPIYPHVTPMTSVTKVSMNVCRSFVSF